MYVRVHVCVVRVHACVYMCVLCVCLKSSEQKRERNWTRDRHCPSLAETQLRAQTVEEEDKRAGEDGKTSLLAPCSEPAQPLGAAPLNQPLITCCPAPAGRGGGGPFTPTRRPVTEWIYKLSPMAAAWAPARRARVALDGALPSALAHGLTRFRNNLRGERGRERG